MHTEQAVAALTEPHPEVHCPVGQLNGQPDTAHVPVQLPLPMYSWLELIALRQGAQVPAKVPVQREMYWPTLQDASLQAAVIQPIVALVLAM